MKSIREIGGENKGVFNGAHTRGGRFTDLAEFVRAVYDAEVLGIIDPRLIRNDEELDINGNGKI